MTSRLRSELAASHHEPARGDPPGSLRVVADPDKSPGLRVLFEPPPDEALERLARALVERGGRLIQEEDGRVELEGAEQDDDLGLAAREVAARLVQERSVSPENREQSQDPFPVEVFPLVDLEREGALQVVRDAPPEEG